MSRKGLGSQDPLCHEARQSGKAIGTHRPHLRYFPHVIQAKESLVFDGEPSKIHQEAEAVNHRLLVPVQR